MALVIEFKSKFVAQKTSLYFFIKLKERRIKIMTQKILVVEDNVAFGNDAKETLGARLVTTYAEFEKELEKERPDVILSDLYFPTGHAGQKDEKMREASIVMIDSYVKRIDRPNVLGKAVEKVLELGVFGGSIDEYLSALKDDPVVKKYRQQIISSYQELEKLRKYQSLAVAIKDGRHDPPSGIFVYRKADELSIPCMIVTSAYHHGIEFQPFVEHVRHYIDTLVDGKKPWRTALESLIRS